MRLRTAVLIVIVMAAAVVGLPAAFLAGLQLWKREVSFGADHWRYRYHIAGTPLAAFPMVRPLKPPVYTQRITSGYGNHIGVTYVSLAPVEELLAVTAERCPAAPWSFAAAPQLTESLATSPSFDCGPVLFSLVAAPEGVKVDAWISD